jgi:hypothetical protein
MLCSFNFDSLAPLRVAKELNAQAQGDRFADGLWGGGDFHLSRFPPEGNCLITLVGLVVTSRLKQMEEKIKRLNISISDCFSKIGFCLQLTERATNATRLNQRVLNDL